MNIAYAHFLRWRTSGNTVLPYLDHLYAIRGIFMLRKLSALFCVAVMTVGFVGCGTTDTAADATNNAADAVADAADDTAEAINDAADSAVDGDS